MKPNNHRLHRFIKPITQIFLTLFLFLTVSCTLLTVNSFSEIPRTINYQGKLIDKQGYALNGTYNVTFRLYDAATSGNLLWQEAHSNVSVQKGLFSVLLGAITPLNLAFDKQYYLGIQVGSDQEMTPRQALASAPYALAAAGGIPRGVIAMWSGTIAMIPAGWALCDGTNGTPDLRDRFIVGARQDDNGVAKANITGSLTQIGGDTSHNHTGYTGQCIGVTDRATGGPDTANGVHIHSISTDEHIPPYYALAYIMKL